MNAKRIREKEAKKKGWKEALERGENPQKIDFAPYIAEETKGIDYHDLARSDKENYGIRILDALAASGLRSIRYVKEVPGVKQVIVNDLDQVAVDQAHENVKFNNVDPAIVCPQQVSFSFIPSDENLTNTTHAQGDAISYMYNCRKREDQFDVIDLDPYGSAVPFIDSAMQAVKDGGMLNVTCTDMAVLSGNHPEACFSKYRSMPMPKSRYLHELALRIVLNTLETSANRYGRVCVPMASFGIDFYVRLFVRVFDSKEAAKVSE